MKMRYLGLLSVLMFHITHADCLRAERIAEDRFRELMEQLRPADGEPWRTIPWKIALLDAQRSAAKEDKPIFIWAMDGHPLTKQGRGGEALGPL